MDQFAELLKGMAERVGAIAAIRTLTSLFSSLWERLRSASSSQQRDWVVKWNNELDALISDLAPAFELGKDTSLPVLIFNVKHEQDAEWRRVSDNLSILQTWFHTWNRQRHATTSPATLSAERLVGEIETLVSIALFTSWAGIELGKWARALSPDDLAYQHFKVTAQRFDLFLTKLESFLRALPGDLVTPTIAQYELFPRISN